MISLSNVIIKKDSQKERVREYGFSAKFEFEEEAQEPGPDGTVGEGSEYLQTVDIFEDAIKQAEEITNQAREEAERIRQEAKDEGYQEGYEAGQDEGYRKAYEDHMEQMERELEQFRAAAKQTIEEVTAQKDKILEKYIDDLKRITLTIAEKVIQTSLRSSGEIIKRMIVGAAGKLKKTQWVKIYVSQNDAGMMLQGDVGLLNELSHLSGNIKIIAMENAEDGTCIIELPYEIIDVSVSTQLENIKGILNNARL